MGTYQLTENVESMNSQKELSKIQIFEL